MHNRRKKKKMKKTLSTFSFLQHYPKDNYLLYFLQEIHIFSFI